MFKSYSFTAAERFIRYVQVDTQSDPLSEDFPSTQKQKDLGRLLVDELQQMGIKDAHMDDRGYIYATIPSNVIKKVPVICFCAHMDTAPDCSGFEVQPVLHKNYQGDKIELPNDPRQVISIDDYPYLKNLKGHDIITASGDTLLGSDDKAGVAEIMDMANYLVTNPDVSHGEIKILFTPDEEVGRGTEYVDLKKLGADFAYTLDGGDAGSLEDETFSADGVTVTVHGVISHPGYAKDKMVNALKVAAEIINELPKDNLSPETTEGKEGFIHPVRIEGLAEKCTIEFIIRDFDSPGLVDKANFLKGWINEVMERHPKARYDMEVKEQYRNMKEVLDKHPEVIAFAKEAIQRAGLTVKMESIRGGTDGSRLSYMGLPTANLFAGQQAIHSRHEFISVQDMNKAVETMVYLAQVWEEKS